MRGCDCTLTSTDPLRSAYLEREMALSSFDVRHRVAVNYVVDLPFGEGRRYGVGTSGFTRALISEWTLTGVTTLQSGFPLAFTGLLI